MPASENTITTAEIARTRAVDFALQFNQSLNSFMEALGTTRQIAVTEGTTLKAIKVVGELQDGNVAEGELIPLSQYETEDVDMGTITLNKWRKSTTAEAILKGGYEQAVGRTTDKMVKDIQKGIRKNLFTFMATGTGTAAGATFQKALANGWGKLKVLWEDDEIDAVYFVNPMDVSEYLGDAQLTTQNAFGMKYVEDFLGIGSALISASVPEGKFYATAKDNIITYYIDMNASELKVAFDLIADETGFIGVNEYAAKDHACVEDLVMSGVTFFPERLDGIVVGTIADNV